MRVLPLCLAVFAWTGLTFAARAAEQEADYWVSPDGDDGAPGTKDRPFRTLSRARDALRELIQAGAKRDFLVLVRGGEHSLREPLVFGREDSAPEGHTITYAAAEGETPRFSGGRSIHGFTASDDGIWRAPVPDLDGRSWEFRELFVDGERRPRARHPNDGYLRVEKVGPDRRTSFTYRAGDLEAYGKVEHIELVFLHDWSISRVGLRSIDTESRTVTLRDPVGPASRHFAMDWFEPDPRYFLEGSPSFLDRPGEWVLDVEKKELLYRPVPGESPSGIRAIAPATEALVVVRGDEATGKPVRGLAFVGLTFEHCAFPLPPHGYAAGQAGFHEERVVPGGGALRRPMPAALTFEIAEDCRFERGRIERCGGSALRFGSRARRNVIASSVIRDVGGNGIMIGEEQTRHIDGQPWWRAAPDQVASENVVIDCLIERCGAQFYGAVGVWVGLAEKTRIAQNEIRHLPYTGVSVGWMWSTTPTPCRENVVERNHIHHVMQILSDGGGIYTLGIQPGSILRGNHIHDVPRNSGRAESNGMFLDEGTTGFIVEGNAIHDTDRSSIRFHRATTNTVRGNVLLTPPDVPPFRYNSTDEAVIEKVENITDADKARALLDPISSQAGRARAP